MLTRLRTFFQEVVLELRKASWPERKEIVESTWVVIVMVVATVAFIGGCDFVMSRLVDIFLK